MSERISEYMSYRMPERMSEYLPERTSEYMSEKMISRWYARNYGRIVDQGGDRSKKTCFSESWKKTNKRPWCLKAAINKEGKHFNAYIFSGPIRVHICHRTWLLNLWTCADRGFFILSTLGLQVVFLCLVQKQGKRITNSAQSRLEKDWPI